MVQTSFTALGTATKLSGFLATLSTPIYTRTMAIAQAWHGNEQDDNELERRRAISETEFIDTLELQFSLLLSMAFVPAE